MDSCLITRLQGVVSLNFQWIPGHVDLATNEKADEEAKRATKGWLSASTLLPKSLKTHPTASQHYGSTKKQKSKEGGYIDGRPCPDTSNKEA